MIARLFSVLTFVAGLAACGGGSEPSTPTSPSPSSSSSPATCFSFAPARPQSSAEPQRTMVQVLTRGSCSWSATSATQWITVVRSGPLYHTGDGTLTLDVDQNKDERFGGCPTTARTGQITIAEQATGAEARLELLQEGSSGPFRVPTGCSVAQLPYGATITGSLSASDCIVRGSSMKHYTFEGFSGQGIRIVMTAGRLASRGVGMPVVRLNGPGGGFIIGAGGNPVIDNPNFDRRLSCGGTYTLEVSSTVSATFNPTGFGNYSLRLDSQN